MIKEAIINDEISPKLETAVAFAKKSGFRYMEMRSVNHKNLALFTDAQVTNVKKYLERHRMKPASFASPMFKWYPDNIKKRASGAGVDTFFFSPYLSRQKKKEGILRILRVAEILGVKYIRIFSGLQSTSKYKFLSDPLLVFALEEAKKRNTQLLLENEPVCTLRSVSHMRQALTRYRAHGLGFWFDVANFYRLQQPVTSSLFEEFADDIHYIHLKDFRWGEKKHVPFGQGSINYKRILTDIYRIFAKRDLNISLEPHVSYLGKDGIEQTVNTFWEFRKKKRVTYALIGCGKIAEKHAMILSAGEKEELRAVFDIRDQQAKYFQKKFDVPKADSLEEVLSDPNIDVVNVCTPHDTHAKIIKLALQHGKRVITEKPVCLNPKEAYSIRKERGYEKNVYVVYQNRFNKALEHVWSLKKKDTGKLLYMSGNVRWYRNFEYYTGSDWRGTKKREGGILYNQGIHLLDIMMRTANSDGPLKKMFFHNQKIYHKTIETEDIILGSFKVGGALASIEVTVSSIDTNRESELFLIYENGSVKISGKALNKLEYSSFLPEKKFTMFTEENTHIYGSGHAKLIRSVSEDILHHGKDRRLVFFDEAFSRVEAIRKIQGKFKLFN